MNLIDPPQSGGAKKDGLLPQAVFFGKVLRFDRITTMEYITCLEGVHSGLEAQMVRWSFDLFPTVFLQRKLGKTIDK